jgi:hypothetical protein
MGSAILGFLIAFIWPFSEYLPFRSQVTVYYAFCAGGLKQGKCDTKEKRPIQQLSKRCPMSRRLSIGTAMISRSDYKDVW